MKKKERESKGDTKIDTPNFIGVQRRRNRAGRLIYTIRFSYKKKRYEFGSYDNAKECAKAHDMFVIKNKMNRKTNFFKKI